MKILFIVESPAKCITIQKILSIIDPENQYIVKATIGHIRDLEKNKLAVDVNNGFSCTYVFLDKKKQIINSLKKEVKECDCVYIATDMDREGESIAWHVNEILKPPSLKRLTFNEITEHGISQALKDAHDINMNIVYAQIARRIIDRIVGFKITPILWKHFGISKLSSGRVQTTVLKLIVDNQKDIANVKYNIVGDFTGLGSYTSKISFSSLNEAYDVLSSCGTYNVVTRKYKENPPPPFTTSTLQCTAFQKYGLSIDTTMKIAQTLYESGAITYMRTSSTSISTEACAKLETIVEKPTYRQQHTSGAHEAIRPTFKVTPAHYQKWNYSTQKVYDLIYNRTIKSVGPTKTLLESVVDLGDKIQFIIPGRVSVLQAPTLTIIENNNSPPFTEGSLVKRMEELGIGRPSTYVSTMERLYKHKYVEKEIVRLEQRVWNSDKKELPPIILPKQKILVPTLLGIDIINFFDNNFSEIIDICFTKTMEIKLDQIENGTVNFLEILQEFWIRFSKLLNQLPVLPVQVSCTQNDQNFSFMYNINNIQYKVRTTRFGPVIENVHDKKFISLGAYLKQSNKNIEDITKQDLVFLLSFPLTFDKGTLNYGRFGFYAVSSSGKTITIPKEWFEVEGRTIFDVVDWFNEK